MLVLGNSAGSRARDGGPRWRVPLALVLLVAVAASPRHAVADEDPYTATVTVDATADTVAKARDVARTDGARRALTAIVEKLSGGPGKSKPLKLGDNQITDLVASFEVANEKMSAVRYTADYTYHFRPAETAKVLQAAGIAISGSSASADGAGGKPVVLLPVYQAAAAVLWDDPNPWREAWSRRPAGGAANLLVPLGDAGDLATIDADRARSGDASALAAIAKRENADDVLVVLAVPRAAKDQPDGGMVGLDVTARRYRGGKFVDAHSDSIDANPGEKDSDFLVRAAGVIAADIDNGWKNAKDTLAGERGSLVVAAPITSLDDWLKLRDGLATLPPVRKLDLKSLSRQEATIEIQYGGSIDQLKSSLAAIKLDLQGGNPTWRLARMP